MSPATRFFVAELIGTASATKDGLLSASIYRKVLQYNSFSNNIFFRIGYLSSSFTGFSLIGVETAHCEFVNICISKDNTKVICSNKPNYANLKVDSEGYIYFSVNKGWSIDALLIGSNTASIVQNPPSDAVDIEVAE